MAHLEHVTITPDPVIAGEQYILSVTISTWDYLGKNYTWADLADKEWNQAESQWQGGSNG